MRVSIVLWLLLLGAPVQAETTTHALAHEGRERTYMLHRPAGVDASPRPAVLLLHGAGGHKFQVLRDTKMREASDRHGFLVISPDALPADPDKPQDFATNPRFWDTGPGAARDRRGAVDDVGFLVTVLDAAARLAALDRRRVFATGFSSGAAMSQRLAIERPGLLAAIAPVGGGLPAGLRPQASLPVLFIHGDLDPVAPKEGGLRRLPWGPPTETRPFRESPQAWAEGLGCGASQETRKTDKVMETRWAGCRGKAPVVFLRVADLGHQWPGGVPSRIAEIMGPYSDALDGTETVWAFFADAGP